MHIKPSSTIYASNRISTHIKFFESDIEQRENILFISPGKTYLQSPNA